MILAKSIVLLEWMAIPEELQRLSHATAERYLTEGSILVNRDGMAYVLRDGRLYFTRLQMDGYDWLLHGPLHDGESLLPPGDDWMDIDPPEGLDDLLPVEISPSIVRGPAEDPEPEAVSAPEKKPEETAEKPVRRRGRPKGSRNTSKTSKARETAPARPPEPVVVTNTVCEYEKNGDILARIADSLDIIAKCLVTRVCRETEGPVPTAVLKTWLAMMKDVDDSMDY